jgi:hypothetical protein
MKITSNLNTVSLLNNSIISIRIEEDGNVEFLKIKPLTIKDSLEVNNEDLKFFQSFCAGDLKEINSKSPIQFDNKMALLFYYKRFSLSEYLIILNFLTKTIVDFKHVDDCFYNDIFIINEQMFEVYCDYMSVILGLLSMEMLDLRNKINATQDEFDKRILEDQKKILQTKMKNNASGNSAITLESIIASVIYEFHFSIDEILNMNYNTLYFFYSQVGRIMGYHIKNIAAGNGLLKDTKHNYWSMTKKN